MFAVALIQVLALAVVGIMIGLVAAPVLPLAVGAGCCAACCRCRQCLGFIRRRWRWPSHTGC